MTTNQSMIVAIGAVVIVAIVAWLAWTRRRDERLAGKYGPEYRRLVQKGSTEAAAREISRREKRLELLHIRPLSNEERSRFADEWQRTQARFVDDPAGAVTEADRLVGAVMTARGYPVAEFDQRAADVSVDHPLLVEHYRAAHEIALRHERRLANTEDLRQAFVHYKALFTELLEERLVYAEVKE